MQGGSNLWTCCRRKSWNEVLSTLLFWAQKLCKVRSFLNVWRALYFFCVNTIHFIYIGSIFILGFIFSDSLVHVSSGLMGSILIDWSFVSRVLLAAFAVMLSIFIILQVSYIYRLPIFSIVLEYGNEVLSFWCEAMIWYNILKDVTVYCSIEIIICIIYAICVMIYIFLLYVVLRGMLLLTRQKLHLSLCFHKRYVVFTKLYFGCTWWDHLPFRNHTIVMGFQI